MPFFPIPKKIKKYFVIPLILAIILPSVYFSFPQKTEAAGWPTWDAIGDFLKGVTTPHEVSTSVSSAADAGANTHSAILKTADFIKRNVLDPLAMMAARMIVKQLTMQTVNWINTGFKGNPAFITNPNQFFQNIGDKVAAEFLSTAPLNFCGPFQAKVRLALAKNYLYDGSTRYTCTLGRLENNFDNFTKDFNQGGWDAWFQVTQNTQNNPYGTYIEAKDQLSIQMGGQKADYSDRLNQGKGFLSYERCKEGSPIIGNLNTNVNGAGATPDMQCTKWDNNTGNDPSTGLPNPAKCLSYAKAVIDSNDNSVTQDQIDAGIGEGDCTEKEIVTPGSVIETQLEKVLPAGVEELQLTTSINSIVSALLTQMFQQVVGSVGSGLRGLSQSSPSNNNNPLTAQMANTSIESQREIDSATKTINDTSSSNLDKAVAAYGATTANNTQANSAPSISLIGDNPMTLTYGATYTEPADPHDSYVAADTTTGQDLTSSVTVDIPFDINDIGTHTVTYSVTDSNNNTFQATRTVNVVETTSQNSNTKSGSGAVFPPTQ